MEKLASWADHPEKEGPRLPWAVPRPKSSSLAVTHWNGSLSNSCSVLPSYGFGSGCLRLPHLSCWENLYQVICNDHFQEVFSHVNYHWLEIKVTLTFQIDGIGRGQKYELAGTGVGKYNNLWSIKETKIFLINLCRESYSISIAFDNVLRKCLYQNIFLLCFQMWIIKWNNCLNWN